MIMVFWFHCRLYIGTMPFIVIENLDIIKTITVKEFNKFTDRYVRILLQNIFYIIWVYKRGCVFTLYNVSG